jgi:hypothetical protein
MDTASSYLKNLSEQGFGDVVVCTYEHLPNKYQAWANPTKDHPVNAFDAYNAEHSPIHINWIQSDSLISCVTKLYEFLNSYKQALSEITTA